MNAVREAIVGNDDVRRAEAIRGEWMRDPEWLHLASSPEMLRCVQPALLLAVAWPALHLGPRCCSLQLGHS